MNNSSGFIDWLWRHAVVVAIIVAVIVCVVVLVKDIFIRQNSSVVYITASTKNVSYSVTMLNGGATQVGSGDKTVRLSPGTYQLTGTDSNGCEVSKVIRVASKPLRVRLSLPDTSQSVVGAVIAESLPFSSTDGPFTIDFNHGAYSPDGCVSNLIITESTPLGREAALEWIRSQGYKPENLNITFEDFSNPLSLGGGGHE